MDVGSAIGLIVVGYIVLVISWRMAFHKWLPPLNRLNRGVAEKERREARVTEAKYQELKRLQTLKKNRDVGAIIDYLNSPISYWPVEAVIALGDLKDQSAVKPLIDTLTIPGSLPAYPIINALKKIGTPSIEPMCTLITNKKISPDIKRQVVDALGDLGNPMAIPALTIASKDDNELIRKSGTKALKKLGVQTV